jgi:hypothetical protein
MPLPRRAFDKKILTWCYAERARAIELLGQVEDGLVTFFEQRGDQPVVDVTSERAERQRDLIHRMNDIIGEFEGRAIG